MLRLSMHDLFICIKSLALISFVWMIEFITMQFVSLSFISPNVREFFIESKEAINLIVSLAVLYATYLKIKNEKNKK